MLSIQPQCTQIQSIERVERIVHTGRENAPQTMYPRIAQSSWRGNACCNDVRISRKLTTLPTLYRWATQAHRRLEQRPRLPRQLLQARRKKRHPPRESEPQRLHLRRKMIRKVSMIHRGGRHRGHRLESLRQAPPEQHHEVASLIHPVWWRPRRSCWIICSFQHMVVNSSIAISCSFLYYLHKKLESIQLITRVTPGDVLEQAQQ